MNPKSLRNRQGMKSLIYSALISIHVRQIVETLEESVLILTNSNF